MHKLLFSAFDGWMDGWFVVWMVNWMFVWLADWMPIAVRMDRTYKFAIIGHVKISELICIYFACH